MAPQFLKWIRFYPPNCRVLFSQMTDEKIRCQDSLICAMPIYRNDSIFSSVFSSSLRILFFQEQMDWTSICRMWVASTLIWLHDCRPDKLLSVRRSSSIILYPQFDEQTEIVCASEIRDSFIQNLNEAKRSERPVRVFTCLTRFSMQKGSSSFLVSTYTLHIDGDWMRQTLTNSRCQCQI